MQRSPPGASPAHWVLGPDSPELALLSRLSAHTALEPCGEGLRECLTPAWAPWPLDLQVGPPLLHCPFVLRLQAAGFPTASPNDTFTPAGTGTGPASLSAASLHPTPHLAQCRPSVGMNVWGPFSHRYSPQRA